MAASALSAPDPQGSHPAARAFPMTVGIRVLAIGVFREGDRILVARGVDPATGEPFYRPLGGGVEFGEHAEAALRREIVEELGATIEEVRLLGVLENIFAYAGRPRHEVIFVFDARLSDASWYLRPELPVTEAGTGWEPARWISVETLSSGPERLVPSGLLALLRTRTGHGSSQRKA
ncbi:MAG TPA: NUDIX hydrolase [Longimicrobium sp.]|nr:NUDIX hydrolase [Longimicrobium sp.]